MTIPVNPTRQLSFIENLKFTHYTLNSIRITSKEKET